MSPILIGLLSFVVIALLIFSGLHVGTALIIVAVCGILLVRGINVGISTLQYAPYDTLANYNYAVFPLFILMGELIADSGVIASLFTASQAWLGRFKGGLGMTVTAMGAALGTVTGSAIAAAAILSRSAFPELVKQKYDPAVSAGLIAAVAPLSIVIPPSVFLAFYGVMAQESVGKLLIAGFIPGFLAAVMYIPIMYLLAVRNPKQWPTSERIFTWRERWRVSAGVIPILIMMLIVLGGIYAGVFTPSEGGAAGSVMAFFFLLAYKRKASGKAAFKAVWESAGSTSMVFFILIGALLYGRFMSLSGATDELVNVIGALNVSRWVVFGLIVVVYIFLGCFLDGISMLAITLPVVHPLMVHLGFDGIVLGVVITMLVGIGSITPPFGIVVFTVKGLVGEKVGLWPIFINSQLFLIPLTLTVTLMMVWPQVALFLPSLMK